MSRGFERAPVMPRTWLLSGIPRSGTSLCCRLAGDLPDTVALSEPIRRPKELGTVDTPLGACARISNFAEQTRARIAAERRAPSIQVEGRLDDNRVATQHVQAGLRRPGAGGARSRSTSRCLASLPC